MWCCNHPLLLLDEECFGLTVRENDKSEYEGFCKACQNLR
jgi:hypothetical protein